MLAIEHAWLAAEDSASSKTRLLYACFMRLSTFLLHRKLNAIMFISCRFKTLIPFTHAGGIA